MERRKNKYIPKIYKITNKRTKKSYIGKTTRIVSRWLSHMSSAKKHKNRKHKFYNAINNSKITDWTFEILEVVDVPIKITDRREIDKFALIRELYWICHYNSVENGYNTNIMLKK